MSGVLLVRDIMTKDVKVVRTDTSIQDVIATMLKFDISSVVVVQKDRPVGLITHKDLLTKVLKPGIPPAALTARSVMTTPVTSTNEEGSMEEAAKLMEVKRFKKLPVVKDGRLVGIVTSVDLIREQPRLIGLLEDLCRPCVRWQMHRMVPLYWCARNLEYEYLRKDLTQRFNNQTNYANCARLS